MPEEPQKPQKITMANLLRQASEQGLEVVNPPPLPPPKRMTTTKAWAGGGAAVLGGAVSQIIVYVLGQVGLDAGPIEGPLTTVVGAAFAYLGVYKAPANQPADDA